MFVNFDFTLAKDLSLSDFLRKNLLDISDYWY